MRIAILTGGSSEERDVALASSVQIVAALRSRGHAVTVIDTVSGVVEGAAEAELLGTRVGATHPSTRELVDRERAFLFQGLGSLREISEADVVFLGLHGGRGEDGTIQTLLETLGVPYTGSGPLGSALAMDKDVSKRLFRDAGVATAPWLMAPVVAGEVTKAIGWPAVVKPSKQGSTVGLTVVRRLEELEAAVAYAGEFDDEVMIERFIPGRELTVGILDGAALPVGEIIPQHELFDYECKYTPGMSQEIFPAGLPKAVAMECQRLAVLAHETLKLGGYSRIDFRLTPDGQLFCLEANTLPGMTATSLLPQAAKAAGIEFADLCERICRTSRPGSRREQSTTSSGFTS
jgi:D-alanine-D-alanine ligase